MWISSDFSCCRFTSKLVGVESTIGFKVGGVTLIAGTVLLDEDGQRALLKRSFSSSLGLMYDAKLATFLGQ